MNIISLSSIFVLAGLAFLAAMLGVQGRPPPAEIVPSDQRPFIPRFFLTEGFYRSFLIHLAFAGVSISIAWEPGWSANRFWDWYHPTVPLVLNLIFGLFAVSALFDEVTEIAGVRWKHVRWILAIGIVVFLLSVGAAYKRTKLAAEVHRQSTQSTQMDKNEGKPGPVSGAPASINETP